MYLVNSWARDGPATSDYWWSIVCALWPPVLLLIMTNYVDDVSIILHYYTLLHLIFLLVTTCYYNDHYYIVITYFCSVITCYYIYHYYLLLRIHYYILLHHYYLIITSLLPHYAISKIHVIMDSLLHIITLACFIITSLLPIMSLFPIITYYWRGNLQMLQMGVIFKSIRAQRPRNLFPGCLVQIPGSWWSRPLICRPGPDLEQYH